MDILNLFEQLTEDEIQETTELINKQIQDLVSTGDFLEYFPEQEIVYFNTKGFDISISTIFSHDLTTFEGLGDNAQANFPKITYEVVLNATPPKPDELENYIPFKMYIDPHKDLNIDDEKELLFLEQFKQAVLKIISIILDLLYKKLQSKKDNDV